MNTIVFLDIDGVLNSSRFFYDNNPLPMGRPGAIDPDAVRRLNQIVDATGAKVVLSTSWRTQGVDTVSGYLSERGFTGSVIGATPTNMDGPRRSEINEWLWQAERLGYRVDRFIVIDDDENAQVFDGPYAVKGTFIWCNHVDGLTDECVQKAISMTDRAARKAGV